MSKWDLKIRENNKFMKNFLISGMLLLALLMGCIGTKEKTNPIVVLETNKGNIELELYPDKAPKTVENFLSYVNSGFYNGTLFHRIVSGSIIQGGGFSADGGIKTTKEPIAIESDNGLRNVKFSIAMARKTEPNSATSQFFINLKDNPALDRTLDEYGYAVFGKVISGNETIKTIASIQTGNYGPYQNWPSEPIIITGAYVKN